MNRSRLTSLGVAALLSPLALAGCGSDDNQLAIAADCTPVVEGVETVSEGKLSMAVAEYPPYVTNAQGELGGVDGEVLTEVARQLCLQPSVQTQSFTAIIESVKNGSADLTAGNWYINDERKQQFEVSDPVYADEMAIVSQDGFDNLDALEGKTIGTTQGYLWVEDLQKALGKDKVKLYATEDAAFQDVKVGRIDAAVITYGGGTQLLKTYKGDESWLNGFAPDERVAASVDTARTAVLIEKGNTELLEAVNTVVDGLREDGALAEILENNGLPASAADVG
jgi:polar amino acid transport system substrate-binding protein